MSLDLKELRNRLQFEGHSHERRVMDALVAINNAMHTGGEILYLTPSEVRLLAVGQDLAYVVRELLRVMDSPTCKLVPSNPPILPIAREALARIDGAASSLPAGSILGAAVHKAIEEASSPPTAPALAPPGLDNYLPLLALRQAAQAMLGLCDCAKPDQKARDQALAALIYLRDTCDLNLPEEISR